MQVKVLQLQKRSVYTFDQIQDKVAINDNLVAFALADGTTQSFKSGDWAELITAQFVENPVFEAQRLLEIFRLGAKEFSSREIRFSSNPAIAALERDKHAMGGTATFIGMQISPHGVLEMIMTGDSNAFFYRKGEIKGVPFTNVDELDNNNQFLNSKDLLNSEVNPSQFDLRKIKLEQDYKIILATDALSRLLLRKPEVAPEVMRIKDFKDLHAFCLKYWENKLLEEDDISAVIIENPLDPNISTSYILPPKNFAFPKESRADFVPSSLPKQPPQNFQPMDPNELKEQFSGIASDFYHVKRKLGTLQVFLFLTVILLVLNIMASSYFFISSKDSEQQMEIETVTQGDETEIAPVTPKGVPAPDMLPLSHHVESVDKQSREKAASDSIGTQAAPLQNLSRKVDSLLKNNAE